MWATETRCCQKAPPWGTANHSHAWHQLTLWNLKLQDSLAQWTAAKGDVWCQAESQCWRSMRVSELIIEFQDIFTMRSDKYGWTEWVFHCIDTSDTRPINQTAHILPLARQAVVNEMLNDMKGQGVIGESVLGLHPSCLAGRRTKSFGSVWTTDGWRALQRRIASCYQGLMTACICPSRPIEEWLLASVLYRTGAVKVHGYARPL
jgi:hypothetical protein